MENAKDQKTKELIASMKSAQQNMKFALDRIDLLETQLRTAASNFGTLAGYLPDNLYCYTSNSNQISGKDKAKQYQADALKNL